MNTPEVTIVDYGVGNLLSVKRGFEHCGAKVVLTSDPKIILASPRVVLPGVGAFPNAMDALQELNLVSVIKELEHLGTPILAICLGMQLLMDESEEFGLTPGLGLIPGRVVAVPDKTVEGVSQKIPHIGWNSIYDSYENSNWTRTLLQDNEVGDSAYFVHSYMAQPAGQDNLVAHAMYGGHKISAVISKNRITGCQFHPEKSGEVGLKILRKFCVD
jgi:glutamine amidotransferase